MGGEVAPLLSLILELSLCFCHTPNIGGFAAHVKLEGVSWLQRPLCRILIVAVSTVCERAVQQQVSETATSRAVGGVDAKPSQMDRI